MGKKRKCLSPDCVMETYAPKGYCQQHFATAYYCRLADCQNRVSVQSQYGFCREHYSIGPKTKPVP